MPNAGSRLIIVFTRAPVAGKVKTRLIPRLGADGAARLQRRLIRTAVRTARDAGTVELHATHRHAWLRSLRVPVRLQRGADLGERMLNALRRRRGAILIGTDAPELRPRDLHRAARLVRGTDVVLAPAEDGGYALIAARRIDARIFEGVRWGGADVLARTLRNISKCQLRYRLLRTVWDVDRPQDVDRIRWLRSSSASPPRARR